MARVVKVAEVDRLVKVALMTRVVDFQGDLGAWGCLGVTKVD